MVFLALISVTVFHSIVEVVHMFSGSKIFFFF